MFDAKPSQPDVAIDLIIWLNLGTVLLLVLMSCSSSSAYSVLTHEEIVDLLWSDEISPLLLKRYPGLTEDQLREAHAYAYGASRISDLPVRQQRIQ